MAADGAAPPPPGVRGPPGLKGCAGLLSGRELHAELRVCAASGAAAQLRAGAAAAGARPPEADGGGERPVAAAARSQGVRVLAGPQPPLQVPRKTPRQCER